MPLCSNRHLNFIAVTFIICSASISPAFQQQNCTTTSILSSIERFQNVVQTRRIRSVIFPNKGFLLLTPAVVKAVLGGRPRGLTYSIEFDMYSPLPDSIEGWKPTILIKKFHPEHEKKEEHHVHEPKPIHEPVVMHEPLSVQELDHLHELEAMHDLKHYLDYMPPPDEMPDGMHNTMSLSKPVSMAESMSASMPIDVNANVSTPTLTADGSPSTKRYYVTSHAPSSYTYPIRKYDYVPGNFVEFPKRTRIDYWRPKINRKPPTHNYIPVDQFHQLPRLKQSDAYTRLSPKNKHYSPRKYYEKWSSYGPQAELYRSLDDVPKWKFHQRYRERRELYEQLEAVGHIFNFNMKACLQRAMCDIATRFPPYGQSLVEDLVRIILNIPTDHDFVDDYSDYRRAPRCPQHLLVDCPYALIDIINKATF